MRSMNRAAAGLVLLSAMCACTGREPPGHAAETDSAAPAAAVTPVGPPIERDAWLRDALAAARLDRIALREQLGEPLRTTRHAQPNRHDPAVTDSLVEIEYPDARFVYYVVTRSANDLLDFARVRSNRHLALMPPGIGTAADSLRAWWGAPVAASDSSLEYDCTSCEVPHPATFEIRDGRVRAITFDLYVD